VHCLLGNQPVKPQVGANRMSGGPNAGRRVQDVEALSLVDDWPVQHVAVAVVASDGAVIGSRGPTDRVFPLASVTKPLAAYAVLLAHEEEALSLDDPAGPEGSTIRHLLAHASGLAHDRRTEVARPGTRRIYSNAGFEVLGETLEKAAGIGFAGYLREAVFTPLGMKVARLDGSPAADGFANVEDLSAFAAELLSPRLIDATTAEAATSVQFPGLAGVLPGFGRQDPNDWGLGVEIRGGKAPHWTGQRNSARTFGHFGNSGTFLWADPDARVACVCLTDREFGPWAAEAWPALADRVLAELSS
jgi:CubicO group peptidase (beta-lactamase class C family)